MNKPFYLEFTENLFEKGSIIETSSTQKLIVLTKPGKTKWRRFLQFLSFGIYKPPIKYKVKFI